jgi:hypothetical protein
MPVICQIALGDSAGSPRPLGFDSELPFPRSAAYATYSHWGAQTEVEAAQVTRAASVDIRLRPPDCHNPTVPARRPRPAQPQLLLPSWRP